ncbi:hypothetical protein [Desulfosediminicola sp.]|uniref:hypothetical protein n=1 Tax=Desulfosediminicola sp. TaxID=2886825 RepID=UPI003AF2D026
MSLADIAIDTDHRSRLRLNQQLDVLTMRPGKRRQLLKKIGAGTRRDLRTNIRKQRTVDGKRMQARADARTRRKMFRNMPKNTITRLKNDHSATVTWKHTGQAKVAYRHHHGIDEAYTAKRAESRYGQPDYKQKCTAAQARALAKEGFRRRVARKHGKGPAILKRVPQKWIRENITLGQAGLILRMMRINSTRGVQSWKIKTPARPILGATEADAAKYLTAMATSALQEMQRK